MICLVTFIKSVNQKRKTHKLEKRKEKEQPLIKLEKKQKQEKGVIIPALCVSARIPL